MPIRFIQSHPNIILYGIFQINIQTQPTSLWSPQTYKTSILQLKEGDKLCIWLRYMAMLWWCMSAAARDRHRRIASEKIFYLQLSFRLLVLSLYVYVESIFERIHQWPGLVQWPSNIRDWRLVQWLTSRNPDFQVFNTSHGYGTSATVWNSNTLHQSRLRDISHCPNFSATVRDFEHYIRDWSLA